jgi:hypothetical protein
MRVHIYYGGFILKRGLILILIVLSLSEVQGSVGFNTTIMEPGFDMKGTITNILSPSSIVIGNYVVNLDGVDPSGLYGSTYFYLMEDLKSYYIGKDVFVKGNYVYLDLNGAYNSQSLNEMIQDKILDLQMGQNYSKRYHGGYYKLSSGLYYTVY